VLRLGTHPSGTIDFRLVHVSADVTTITGRAGTPDDVNERNGDITPMTNAKCED
jgi:hypothetical protein